MLKKELGKPLPIQILMDRTYSTASVVLSHIESVSFTELTMSTYLLCKDEPFREIVRLYDAQIELAGVDEEKFIFGLHSFYNAVTAKIRKNNQYYEFAQFIGAVTRLSDEKSTEINKSVINAYMSLIVQTFEYLRPEKFKLETCAYGIHSDGSLLIGPYPYAYSDVPAMKIQRKMAEGKPIRGRTEIISLYKEVGLDIHSIDDLNALTQAQRTHIMATSAMFPFINEFTFDMAQTEPYYSHSAPFEHFSYKEFDEDELGKRLKNRRYTLPGNGVLFQLNDPAEEFLSISMKEIFSQDSVYVLYKLRAKKGLLCGYFEPCSSYLFSVLKYATAPHPFNSLKALVMNLYASQVLSPEDTPDINSLFTQKRIPVEIEVYCSGGRLKNTYNSVAESTPRGKLDPDAYDREEKAINGYIRKLPNGAAASEEAKAIAKKYGYDLGADETYVRPFQKVVFVKKKPENEK